MFPYCDIILTWHERLYGLFKPLSTKSYSCADDISFPGVSARADPLDYCYAPTSVLALNHWTKLMFYIGEFHLALPYIIQYYEIMILGEIGDEISNNINLCEYKRRENFIENGEREREREWQWQWRGWMDRSTEKKAENRRLSEIWVNDAWPQ